MNTQREIRKQELIKQGVFEEFRKERKHYFDQFGIGGVSLGNDVSRNGCVFGTSYSKAARYNLEEFKYIENRFGEEDTPLLFAIETSLQRKRKRISRKQQEMLYSDDEPKIAFVTFTFNNETLENTTDETRRRYIRRAMKSVSDIYVGNYDKGKQNEREHYHALIDFRSYDNVKEFTNDLERVYHNHGFIKVEQVRLSIDDCLRTKKYLLKLGLHAIKDTTGRQRRLIYSRNITLSG